MVLECLEVLLISDEIAKNMIIKMDDFGANFDVSKLKNNKDLPAKVAFGAEIIYQSSFKGDLVLDDHHFICILEAAQHFKMHRIESYCNKYFESHMLKSDPIESLIIAEKYFSSFKSTMNLAISNVCKIFHKLPEEDLFKLETKHLLLILNNNYKIDCSEVDILKIVFCWMLDYEMRDVYVKGIDVRVNLMNIFHSIQFSEITKEFQELTKYLDTNSHVYTTFELLFDPIKKTEELKEAKTPNMFKKMIKSFGFPTDRGVDYALVQLVKSDYLQMVFTMPLNKISPEWEKIYTINVGGCVLEKWSTVYENNLYVFGNAKGKSDEIFYFGIKYCPPTDNWTNLNGPGDGYVLTSLNAIGDCFIGIGTFEGGKKKFAMKYDPKLDVWTDIAKMPASLQNYAAISYEDTLLISGGYKTNSSECSRDFWKYTLSTNVWTELRNMRNHRSNHSMLKNETQIYFIGGLGHQGGSIEDVGCYDIVNHSFQWITKIENIRFNAEYYLFDNKIFIRNGFMDKELTKPLSSVEVFDLNTNMWGQYFNLKIHYLMFDSIHMYKS